MAFTWRFYADSDGRWHWEKLAPDRTVVAQSAQGFDDYERCKAAAAENGYVFERAQTRTVRPGNENRSWRS